MLPATSPIKPKKLKSPGQEVAVNTKTSVTCSNVPEGLFDPSAAKKHFSKFGQVQKIRLLPKRQMCVIEYDQPSSAEKAVLNAGAFDGFMFDVTRTKARVRRHSKRDDDPDWLPDPLVEEELSAMGGTPTYRVTRQKVMDVDPEIPSPKAKMLSRVGQQTPIKKKVPVKTKKVVIAPATSGIESPVLMTTTQSSLSTSEAAAELFQLRSRISIIPDEQWRTLDARDRILRSWGGAGSRVKVGGATIGTCQDMCPEKELLHRLAEHQVMTLETVLDSDGVLERRRAVKQYSRSSADQEMPMCYELRPPTALMRTCAYLLHEIADTRRLVSLADWFHFLWDRFRSIRKDITQQALCCAESISLVEMCARFHAHCAARLADLEHTQFDQKLNTDNITKCLQTLKHMYADVDPEQKPNESEFRGYIALLNLGDANFWWEIKQLPTQIQKSKPIAFAIKVFNALDNNNYVRFFRLIKDEATYLQACILLRYFNDVRARALARIVKAYAPRGGSRFPAEDMMSALAFESIESLNSFINHYGLRFARTDDIELSIILDRNQFIEDSDPYPIARAIHLIESKRNNSCVGEIIAGGKLPEYNDFRTLFTSFTEDGKLKQSALIAEDQGYNTTNDSNKDVKALKAEILRLCQGGKIYGNMERPVADKIVEPKADLFVKPAQKSRFPGPAITLDESNSFLFKPAIVVASTDIIKQSPEKIFSKDASNLFAFSPPQATLGTNVIAKDSGKKIFQTKPITDNSNVFGKTSNDGKNIKARAIFGGLESNDNLFKKSEVMSVFGQTETKSANVFGTQNKNVFANKTENSQSTDSGKNIFNNKNETLFTKPTSVVKFEKGGNIFGNASAKGDDHDTTHRSNIFGTFAKTSTNTLFSKPETSESQIKSQSIFSNGDSSFPVNKLSPGSLFKSVVDPPNGPDAQSYSIFLSKNKAQTVADNILNSLNSQRASGYEFNQNDDDEQKQLELQRQNEEEEERLKQEKQKRDEEKRQEQQRQEEARRKKEALKRQEELKILEEKRRKEELRKQEALQKKLEEERKAELKRKAEEEEKRFKERVNTESGELTEELVNEVRDETVRDILKDEIEQFESLIKYASTVTEDMLSELCSDICKSEMKAEKFWTEKITKRWFYVWRKHYLRNIKRRNLLEETPVWLTERTPLVEAQYLRRFVEKSALENMNAIHRGYKFTGELNQLPTPDPYNIMEIIRSPLLKRMKQINYPYDKCFFWKLTLVSPGEMKWLHRKIHLEKWLLDVFSDKKKHDVSATLIHVGKQSWNHLMDFAISVSLTNNDRMAYRGEALEGANGVLFYMTESENNFSQAIEETLKHKYPYQVVPVAIIMPTSDNVCEKDSIQSVLNDLVNSNVISAFRIFTVDNQNISVSLNATTKSALKWLAKKFPEVPPLEIDYLKSICQRYLCNEVWCMLRSERDGRMNDVLKDLYKLVKCFNAAVDKLTELITNEELFNYASFPLEFQKYLDCTSPYPKPYEFIPSNVKNSENISAIKNIMKQLRLPDPSSKFSPMSAINMQTQIRSYCNQIGWFEEPEDVVCKIIAVIPNELSDESMPCEDFIKYFAQYDLIDFLNIVVYEKINGLKNFENRFAIYEKSVLEDYRSMSWFYEIGAIKEIKHKAIEYEDEIDYFIEAKRRKIELDASEYLMLEDRDRTMVDESIKEADETMNRFNHCTEAVKQLELQLEEEKQKSLEFENMLQAALANIQY